MLFFSLSTILLVPGYIEYILQLTSDNMGLHGVYLEIYCKRNIFYTSLITTVPFYLFGRIYYGLLFLALTIFIYFKACYHWREIIFKNDIINV